MESLDVVIGRYLGEVKNHIIPHDVERILLHAFSIFDSVK
jgi:hypothetical protein